MPPKKTAAPITSAHKAALQEGFRSEVFDPAETHGPTINQTIKNNQRLFAILKPLFSVREGGTRTNNNTLYTQYKEQGCEYIVVNARNGVRFNAVAPSPPPPPPPAAAATEGARRSAADISGEEEDSDDSMSGRRSAPPVPGAAAAGAGTSTPQPSSRNRDEEGMASITKQMKKLMVYSENNKERGYDFEHCPPYMFWTYSHNGVKYVKYEFLVWGGFQSDFEPKVSLDGKTLTFASKIPDRFVEMLRVKHQYLENDNWADNDVANIGEAMFQGGRSLMQMINDRFDLEDIKPFQNIKLPFQCVQQTVDPYDTSEDQDLGDSMDTYPLNSANEDRAHRFNVYHVNLREAAMPRNKKSNSRNVRRIDF